MPLKTNETGQRRYPENDPKESITSALNVHSLSFFKGIQATEPKGALAQSVHLRMQKYCLLCHLSKLFYNLIVLKNTS